MKLPVLYTFRRCPYAMRARISLYYSKISYEHREILLKDRPGELYALSPKGTVPVLNLPDGKVLDESLDIMKWSMSIYDSDSWFVNNISDQLNAIKTNDYHFKKWLDKYKYHDRYPEFPVQYYKDKCEGILNSLEKKLDEENFLFSQKISLGDMALLPFIRQFANVDIIWFNGRFVNLSKWMGELIESEVFQSMMKKYEIWNPSSKGQDIIFDN